MRGVYAVWRESGNNPSKEGIYRIVRPSSTLRFDTSPTYHFFGQTNIHIFRCRRPYVQEEDVRSLGQSLGLLGIAQAESKDDVAAIAGQDSRRGRAVA